MKYLVSWVTDEDYGVQINADFLDFQSKKRFCSKIISDYATAENLCHRLNETAEENKIVDYGIYVNLDEYLQKVRECESLKEQMRRISTLINDTLE